MAPFSLDIVLQLLIDGTWVDFTRLDSVTKMLGDGKSGYTVTMGQANETGKLPPMSFQFGYQDDNAVLNEDNPLSTYYGKVAQYTKARLSDDGGVTIDVVGEIAAMAVNDTSGNVAVIQFEVASIDRRLSQGQKKKPLKSPAYRAFTALENDTTRIVYYPLEEEKNATELISPYANTSAAYAGTLTFGGYTAHPAAERMIQFGTNGLIFLSVPPYTSTEHKVCGLFNFPATLPAGTIIYRMYCSGGNTSFIDLEYGTGVNGALRLLAYDNANALIDTANFVDWSAYLVSQDVFISLEFTQNGANLDNTVLVVNQDPTNFGITSADSLTGVTIGRITYVTIGQSDCSGLSFGNFAIGNDTTAFSNFIDLSFGGGLGTRGYAGEYAGWRIFRLCDEEDVPLNYYGGFSDTLQMGPQRIAPFMDLLSDAQLVDNGILYADKAGLDGNESMISYRNLRDMYNMFPRFTVDVTGSAATSQLSGSLRPKRDDQGRRNDVAITRNGGAVGRYIIPDGDMQHLSTQDPPNGMGPVDSAGTVQLYYDKHARQIAAWLAHLGAWRGPRYPKITMDMWRTAIQSDAAVVAGVKALLLGDIIQVNTTSAISRWIPRNDFSLQVRGYQYTKTQTQHTISYNTIPGEAWEIVATDTNSSTLAIAVDSDDTDLYVDMSSGPSWKNITLSDTPYYVQINGDVCRCNQVADFTPTFVSAGSPTHGSNASVVPGAPASVANGDALILFAAIRNSGTGTVNLPTGWRAIAEFGNLRIMGRYRQNTADDTPTVSFTGGVANATTSAVILAFRNCSIVAALAATQLNGSAQNIATAYLKKYPKNTSHRYQNCVVISAGWKQDDWTSVAALSGFTEALDNSTTTGDDQGLVIDYRIDSGATEAAATSFVVTGGASAISRSIVLALRPITRLAVTRNLNGSATSHAVGATVRGWRMGVTGL